MLDQRDKAAFLQQRIGIDRHHQIVRGEGQSVVQHACLAPVLLFTDEQQVAPARPSEQCLGIPHGRGRPVGRAVVQHHDLQRAGIIQRGDAAQCLADQRFLVIGGDEDAQRGPLLGRAAQGMGPQHQAGHEKRVHEARHIGDESQHEQRCQRVGKSPQIAQPGQRQPDAEYDPPQRQDHRQSEAPYGPAVSPVSLFPDPVGLPAARKLRCAVRHDVPPMVADDVTWRALRTGSVVDSRVCG